LKGGENLEREELEALGLDEAAAEAVLGSEKRIRDEYEERIRGIERENEIDLLVRESGARNVKAVKSLLGETEGDDYAERVREELEKMKKSSETSFLFETKKSFSPAAAGEKLPDSQRGEYEASLTRARNAGDRIAAIKIKQKAASEGIMLI
jgi:hypothetical protein